MEDFELSVLKVSGLKCFGETPEGFEQMKLINLIIGRNNSGKSSLVDLLEHVIMHHSKIPALLWRTDTHPKIILGRAIEESDIVPHFDKARRSTNHGFRSDLDYGMSYIGQSLAWSQEGGDQKTFVSVSHPSQNSFKLPMFPGFQNIFSKMMARKHNFLQQYTFRKLLAERNVSPENSRGSVEAPNATGASTTNLVQSIINRKDYNREMVEVGMLRDMREILGSDARLKNIRCEQTNGDIWEILLDEDGKALIPLSASGSGIKTVVLVLANMSLVPYIEKKSLSKYVFAFEELENNLHPALLRRLLSYIARKVENERCHVFLTTHSSVAIDMFSRSTNSQIIHVTQRDGISECRTVQTYIDNKGILDDLDIRASDLLQANVIVWVEGPTDRAYFNAWIELWSEQTLAEGTHYQCMLYGGKLLSHYHALPPDQNDQGVSMLRVGRNAIVLIDSDKKKSEDDINRTKQRIVNEIVSSGGLEWVTAGKEIENYIPASAVQKLIPDSKPNQVRANSSFFNYLDKLEVGLGTRYNSDKVRLASEIIPHLDKASLARVLDLGTKLDEVTEFIKRHNDL